MRELVMIKENNGTWNEVFNASNTEPLNITTERDAINYIRNTYPYFKDMKFVVDGHDIWAIIPDDPDYPPFNPGTVLKPKLV
jgi:hypothetical protein